MVTSLCLFGYSLALAGIWATLGDIRLRVDLLSAAGRTEFGEEVRVDLSEIAPFL
jgi:hypothetical protein